jgi:hypothetical protein
MLPALAQDPPQIDAGSRPAVATLRAVAQAIKECPRATLFESKKTEGPTAGVRIYQGPPTNIIWDITATKSARSPYSGYIEFSLPQEFSVPFDVTTKYLHKNAEFYAKMRESWPNLKYRYEFDIGPPGLQLTMMFFRPIDKTEWSDSDGHGCWDDAARKGNSGADAATQTAADVAALSIISVGGAFLALCDTDNAITKEACRLWLGGFYNGLAATGAMVVATPKEAAKNNLVCLPQTYTDEELSHRILKYIEDHPREAAQPTATLALAALHEAFPCK